MRGEGVEVRDDLRRRAVVAHEINHLAVRAGDLSGETLLEVRKEFHRGSAKAIQRLVIIAHHGERTPRLFQQLEIDGFLHRVGIVILINQ